MSDQDSKNQEDAKVLGDGAGVYIPNEEEQPGGVPIDFGSFIVGLYQSALISMGQIEHSDGFQDLEAARQTIEILRILEKKTKGNLEPEEAHLLGNLLYELRVKYVSMTR